MTQILFLLYILDHPNYERRQMIRYKVNKYLIRAEKIYNMYLAPEIKNLQITVSSFFIKSNFFTKVFNLLIKFYIFIINL